jgi:hypothetical protein
MKRVLNDTLISMAAVAVLLAVLVSIDPRVREQLVLTARSASIGQVGSELARTGSVLVTAAREQSVEHAPLAVFILAGTLLFILMART